MADSRWDRVKEIVLEAYERPAAERAVYLDQACGGDPQLRAEVQSLLDAHDAAGSFLEGPVVPPDLGATESVAGLRPSTPLSEGSGTVIDRYKLLQRIGEGGFGLVYMAEQLEPVRRKVALKIIKLGMDTRQVIARFEAERQALALMDHPNIARVLDAGATETGRPYFVMELVRGIPITEYCDQNNLSTRERLELFASVCAAVHHAHQKGIIHRDLKPTNVMVTLHDGVPVPKVIDFGIAKATNQRLTEKTLFTEYHQFIGTPQYMSPEQAEMSGLDVDTRTDIYSLGVLLYELLTGTTPFDPERLRSLAFTEIHRMIREEDPHKPSTRISTLGAAATDTAKNRATDVRTLHRTLSGDLDWIVMKALDKDRTRRYETANDFLLDIRRHLENEPVLASPPTPFYRLKKFIRRNRTAVTVTAAVGAALVIGMALATYGFLQANRERAIARREAEAAKTINAFFNEMLVSIDPMQLHLHSHSAHRGTGLAPDVTAQFDHGISVVEMLRRATGRIEASFAGKPELEALARETIGTTLLGLDANDDAVEQCKMALAVRREFLGDDHPEVHRSKLLVAWALFFAGRMNEAQEFAGQALADLERLHGTSHPLTLSAASLRGWIYSEQGEFAHADSLFGITLERQRRVLGSEHRDTIVTLITWASAYCWRGRGREAAELAGEAYETARRSYSPEDAIVLEAEAVYGFALTMRGEMTRAKGILRPSLKKCRRICGETHITTLWAARALARALTLPEEEAEAESLYAKVREAKGPSEWTACRDLGLLMIDRGKHEEGLAVLREQYEYWHDSHEDVADHVRPERLGTIQRQARNNYLNALANLGRWQDVRALVTERIEELRATIDDSAASPGDLNSYAWLLLTCEPEDLRDPEGALICATRALTRCEERDQVLVGLIHDTQARAYQMVGDLGRAVDAQRRAVEVLTAAGDKATAAQAANTLVRYMLPTLEDTEAVDGLMRIIIGSYGTGTAESVDALCRLGQELAGRGRHAWAGKPFRQAVESGRSLPNKLPLLESLIAWCSARTGAGEMEEARELFDEATALYSNLFGGDPVDWHPGIGYADTGERSLGGVNAKRDLAMALIDMGRLEEADELIRQVAAVSRSRARYGTGRLLLAKGDAAGAEPFLRREMFFARLAGVDQEKPHHFARLESDYGRCLIDLRRYDEAEDLLVRAHARAVGWAGPHSTVAEQAAAQLERLRRER